VSALVSTAVEDRQIFYELSDYHLLNKDSTLWNYKETNLIYRVLQKELYKTRKNISKKMIFDVPMAANMRAIRKVNSIELLIKQAIRKTQHVQVYT
jgi:hypothetical protein